MDFHLKQWRNQHESAEQHSTKMPKLLPAESHQQPESSASASALPLFLPEPNSKVSTLSDSTFATNGFPRMGSYFSLAQWQELELQALIFRYMLAGTAVPHELLQPIKKSLLHSPSYFLHHPLQHYQPALLQSGYWGRGAMDPEPGRCRRTDGKKWRCSRDVVVGQKYCERHMHRGRNRSRKPVELPTPTSAAGGGSLAASSSIISSQPLATVSLKSPFDLLHLNERSSGTKNEDKVLVENQNQNQDHVGGDGKSGGQMLRHFFDDWPRSLQQTDNAENNAGGMNSATCLSISMPGNTSSDVSLKLSTGYGEDPCPRNGNVDPDTEQLQLNWAGGWTSANQVASMGGPLAEALRSSTSTSSPTSVLHQLPPSSGSETSFIST
ncbi:growth-regulating factor 3 [Gastrolobium bilobum]|uniref:growth-regulating factor 3 n=1 Tax=Gastrolobium bilobum TaxID=150636 RepID=UPI002AB24DE8|nr:growth-regulating factor 3 [Gastrolobium bilobum]